MFDLDPQILAQLGRRGDTMVAHISPEEAAILKLLGGHGGTNPYTGLPEFWDDGGNDPGGVGGDTGSTGYGGDGTGGGFGAGEEAMGQAAASAEAEAQANRDAEAANAIGGSFNFYENPGPAPATGFYEGIMDDLTSLRTISHVPGFLFDQYGPVLGGIVGGPVGAAGVAAAQGKGAQAGALGGMTFGGMVAGPFGAAIGGLAGYGIGSLFEGGVTAPDRSPGDDEGNPNAGTDYSSLAQNMVSGPTGVSTAQTVAQPASFDRDAFGQFGQGMINQQSKSQSSGSKAGSANRNIGTDSGQIAGQMAIANQQRQQKMQQWQQLMSDPNMGYQDLAQSLMNILA